MSNSTLYQKRHWLFVLLFSWIIASYLSIWMAPERSMLEPVALEEGWIQSHSGIPKRGYFRHSMSVNFKPTQAWVALASDDYDFYVNGLLVASNSSSSNLTNALQQSMSELGQSLSAGNTIPMVRTPDLQKLSNNESIFPHLIDITPHLVEGENLLAIYVQSSQTARFAIKGEILGKTNRIPIKGHASTWRTSMVKPVKGDATWDSPDFIDIDWVRAHDGGSVATPSFSTIPAAMVTTPWNFTGMTTNTVTDELSIQHPLPSTVSGFSAPDERYWIRLFSLWPYALFIDDEFIADVKGSSGVAAIDITPYIARGAERISLHLTRPQSGTQRALPPLFSAQGPGVSAPGEWSFLTNQHPHWLSGQGEWQLMSESNVEVIPQGLSVANISTQTLSWYSHFTWLIIISFILVTTLVVLLERFNSSLQKQIPGYSTPSAYAILSVPTGMFLFAILAKMRWQESDLLIIFLDPAMIGFWLWLGPAALLLSLFILLPRYNQCDHFLQSIVRAVTAIDPRIWLFFIVCLGFLLRTYNIGFEALQADEGVSWDAARGIVNTGAPEAVSGVYYTRSPLYHYFLAGWLSLFGDTLSMARLYSVIPGVGVLIAVYYLVLAITKRHSLALLCSLLLAIDPWQINMSRNIRFYQQLQFFGVLTTLFFLRGFIWKEGKRYQNLFFAGCLAAVTSQEVFVITFPAFSIAALYYYREFSWSKDRNVWIGFITMMSLTIIDILVFSIVCLTPHVGVATTSGSIMQLHLLSVQGFYNTFLFGNTRVHILYLVLFTAGFFYWARHPNRAIITLYLFVLLTLFTVTVLVMQIANRYVFCLYPAFIIIAVITADRLFDRARELLFFSGKEGSIQGIAAQRWSGIMILLLMAMVVVNVEPGKVLGSYESNRNYQHQHALQLIEKQRLDNDILITVHPMPAAIVFSGLDYYLMESISFDEVFISDKGIIDRWSGGKLISKIGHLHRVLMENERVWIIMDDAEVSKFSDEMLAFIEQSAKVEYEFFGGKIYLWQQDAGLLSQHQVRSDINDSY